MEDDWVHASAGPRALGSFFLHGYAPGSLLATVTDAGAVEINWAVVEATAADPHADKQTWQFAKLLLAARGAK